MNHNLCAAGHRELIGAQALSGENASWRPSSSPAARAVSGEPRLCRGLPHRSAAQRDRAELTLFSRVLTMLRAWRQHNRDHRDLARLDDRMLRDIGLTQDDVSGDRHPAL